MSGLINPNKRPEDTDAHFFGEIGMIFHFLAIPVGIIVVLGLVIYGIARAF